ncbi:YdhK family protein [Pallidibacillus pasinlerensis]|uniref:YdhK family protein n=1 Tax=Pallidibacillus pasinlerensis TaxID=2703818 RepID=A0ABW9ZZ53_9BACI|nr:YdhK family protein [Pallidibacillus pasinlerensis]NCU16438.1 YdhK family protein [Pallidibacillus pasinlerensis]
MKKQKVVLGISSMLLIFLLSACANGGEPSQNENADNETETQENVNNSEEESDSTGEMDHSEMNHSGGEVPQGLTEAENPTYPVGSKVILHADHMAGMNGAEATVSGAFDTTVYSVTYTPTTGGEPVEDHKWVVHEEIENPSEESYKPGDQVVLNAEHMKGMDGATATIDTANQTTVYMVDYTDKETGEKITNHMWVTEDELSPVE